MDQVVLQDLLYFLLKKNKKSCPLYWESKEIGSVFKSSLDAGTLATTEVLGMAFYLRNILSQAVHNFQKNVITTELIVHNHSLHDRVYSTKCARKGIKN